MRTTDLPKVAANFAAVSPADPPPMHINSYVLDLDDENRVVVWARAFFFRCNNHDRGVNAYNRHRDNKHKMQTIAGVGNKPRDDCFNNDIVNE